VLSILPSDRWLAPQFFAGYQQGHSWRENLPDAESAVGAESAEGAKPPPFRRTITRWRAIIFTGGNKAAAGV